MAKKPETKFKEKIQKIFKKIQSKTYRIKIQKIQQKTIRGTPDFVICANGKYIEWELKVGKGKADQLQLYNLHTTSMAGGNAWIVYPENLEWSFNHLFKLAELPLELLEELNIIESFIE